MILTFKCPDTEVLFAGRRVPRFVNIETLAMRKLAMLHRAERIEDPRVPPGNRLEPLSGDRSGQWSIRVKNQWRLCFRFRDGHAQDVEIVDYH